MLMRSAVSPRFGPREQSSAGKGLAISRVHWTKNSANWARVTIPPERREGGRNGSSRLDVDGAGIRADAAFCAGRQSAKQGERPMRVLIKTATMAASVLAIGL